MKSLLTLAFLLVAASANCQLKETYDIISFNPPQGWTKETTNSAVSFVVTNNKTGQWCRVMIFKSIASSGNAITDFNQEWATLITKQYDGTTKPTPEASTADGWTAHSGVSKFTWQGQEGIVLLNSISGFGLNVSVIVIMNGQEYMNVVEPFLDSIELKRPGGEVRSGIQVVGSGSSGITKTTTTFDDGWVAHVADEYVLVTKEEVKYYMHYGFPIPSNEGGGEAATTKANWDKFITPRYTVTNLWLNPDVGSFGGSFNYYAEGTAIEKSNGKEVFIGFRTIIEGGAYFCVEAIAPNKESYQKHFPSLNMLKDMRNSNRFAVTRDDVIGEWSSSDASALQYYNVYTGQSAGMQFSQGGQEFYFKPSDDYNANISGAMGNMGGSQIVFDNKYKGKFTVTDWEITLTNYSGVTQVFTAYFEALKGGRILHIAKKDAPGVHYALVKVK